MNSDEREKRLDRVLDLLARVLSEDTEYVEDTIRRQGKDPEEVRQNAIDFINKIRREYGWEDL